jgi:hypothetical protein
LIKNNSMRYSVVYSPSKDLLKWEKNRRKYSSRWIS